MTQFMHVLERANCCYKLPPTGTGRGGNARDFEHLADLARTQPAQEMDQASSLKERGDQAPLHFDASARVGCCDGRRGPVKAKACCFHPGASDHHGQPGDCPGGLRPSEHRVGDRNRVRQQSRYEYCLHAMTMRCPARRPRLAFRERRGYTPRNIGGRSLARRRRAAAIAERTSLRRGCL